MKKFQIISLIAIGILSLTLATTARSAIQDEALSLTVKPTETLRISLDASAMTSAGIDSLGSSTLANVTPSLLPINTHFDLCFTAFVQSPDIEYLDHFDVDLPDGWMINSVAPNSVPAANGCGSALPPVVGVGAGNVVYWQSTGYPPQTGCGAWVGGAAGSNYNFCTNVTIADTTGAPWMLPWNIIGDGFGGAPHQVSGSYGPVDPLWPIELTPEDQFFHGCGFVPQDHTLTLWNNTGYDTTVNLAYNIVDGLGACSGPASVPLTSGGSTTIPVSFTPYGMPGEATICQVFAVDAADPANNDHARLTKNLVSGLLDPAGWQLETITNATPVQWGAAAVGSNPAAAGPVGYYAGGLVTTSVLNPDLQMYDPGMDTWTQLTDLPNPRFSPVAGWIDGLLYLAGGYNASFGATNDLQVYDPATNTWDNTTPPDMPNLRGGGAGGVGVCASGAGECLFHVGGSPDSTFLNTTLETWQYEPVAASWTQLDNKPAGSSPDGFTLGAGVGCQGDIYVGGDYRGYHEFYRLDATQPAGSQWTQLADIPPAAGAMTPALVCKPDMGAILLIGGDPDGFWGTYNDTVYVYDISADTWLGPLPKTLNVPQLGSVGLHMHNAIWTFGGTVGSGAITPVPHESIAQIMCASPVVWDKYINEEPWHPGITVTVQTSDTIMVEEVLQFAPPVSVLTKAPQIQPIDAARNQGPASRQPSPDATPGQLPETETMRGQQPPQQALPVGTPRILNGGGLLYLTSLNLGDTTFAVYNPAVDAWTNLAGYETGCQMAVSASAELYAYGYSTGTIDHYDPATDTWSPVMAVPGGSSGFQCNLEITNAGEFLYTEWDNPTLWYTSGGTWNTLAIPFDGNAMGDYDPTTDQYVIGEQWTTNAHWIDVHTWAITDFTSPVPNGEYARFGVVMGNRYYFEAGGSNVHSFDLSNPALPPFDHGISPGWYTSAAADRANGLIYSASLDGSQLNLFDPATNVLIPLAGSGLSTGHSSLAFASTAQSMLVYAQNEFWDPNRLTLLDWAASSGEVIVGPESLIWSGVFTQPVTINLTKWFHVKPCTWTDAILMEELWLNSVEVEQRPIGIHKLPPDLWIDAQYDPAVVPGAPADFSLLYGNDSGYENDVWIRNTFPVEAPFLSSVPPPENVDPNGLWAEWSLGDLAMDSQGSIDVTVLVQPGLPVSTTLQIWDGILNHVGELSDEVFLTFHVEPFDIQWDKTIDGLPWVPDMEITRQTSDTIVVEEVLHFIPPIMVAGSMPFTPVNVTGWPTVNPGITLASPAVKPIASPNAPVNPEAVLWNQPLSEINQAAYVNQDFLDFPTYSSFLADDFTNAAAWNIDTIFIPGDGWNGFTTLMNATALNWAIYADCGGVPCGDPSGIGNPPIWYLSLPPNDPQVLLSAGTPGGLPSNTTLNPATPLNLPPGHYWLLFWPSMSFSVDGQYGRQPSDTANGYTGQFINPGGGFGYGTYWQEWNVLGPGQHDIAFRLEGEIIQEVHSYVQNETWNTDHLHLLDWAATGGLVTVDPLGSLEWTGEFNQPITITLTKWFHVEPCTWAQTVLEEDLWVDMVEFEQRPVTINKLPPELWIDAQYNATVVAGQPADFVLLYGNDGGYENNVSIRMTFPPEAPFASSVPSPTNVDPNGLWAEWTLGDLPMDSQGIIIITIDVNADLPLSTIIDIGGDIINHVDDVADQVFISTVVGFLKVYLPLTLK